MARLLFEKTGNAVWISHLDLMRLFQRAFKRAELSLTHTQGFNPRPSVSIALPLSVGVSSRCELLEFNLEDEGIDNEEIKNRLNRAVVDGIHVLRVYDGGQKLRDLALLLCSIRLEYDAIVSPDAAEEVSKLFSASSLMVSKKSKNGIVEQDIIPLIRRIDVSLLDTHTLQIDALIRCQNPSLNPMQLAAAVERYLPQWRPDHVVCSRVELYDENENIFR